MSNHGDLNVSDATFGPRSSERTDRMLRGVAQSHLGINDEVIDVAIAIQVQRNCMSVIVVIVEGPASFVFAGQFRTVDWVPVAQPADDGTMEQLRLGKRARARGQSRSIAAGRCQ